MSSLRFLCDENVPSQLFDALVRQEPAMDIFFVGEENAPRKGTADPELLIVAEAGHRALITWDRRTMPHHIADHLAAGHHTWGVFFLRERFPLMRYVNDLVLLWAASQAEEWLDRIESIPF